MDNAEFLRQIKSNNDAWRKDNQQKDRGQLTTIASIIWRATLGNTAGKIAFILIVGVISLYSMKQNAEFSQPSSHTGDVATEYQCVGQGIAYFKSIGSFPRLSNGTLATSAAADRCSRTTNAFRGLN